MSKAERESVVSYYKEMIADGLESGEDEQTVINSLGNPYDVANSVLRESGISSNEDEKDFCQNQPPIKKGLPIWAMLIIGFFGVTVGIPVVVGLVAVWFALLVSLWACFVSLAVSAVGCTIGVLGTAIMGIFGAFSNGWALVGSCMIGAGVCALLSVGFWHLAIGFCKITARVYEKIIKRGARE